MLKEDLHLATPPPHPSEAPVANPNPLATAPQPATAGTRLTLLNLDVTPLAPTLYRTTSRSDAAHGSIQEHPDETQSSTDPRESSSDAGRLNSTEVIPPFISNAPAFGEGNALLAPVAQKDANKRRKPKNNMTKSNSSFISRVINHEAFNKRLQERARDGLFAFANINRAFQWLDLSSPLKVRGSDGRLSAPESPADRLPGRVFDKDPFHQGPLSLPRREQGDQELDTHRRRLGVFHRRDHLVGTHHSAVYSAQQKCAVLHPPPLPPPQRD